MSDQLNEKNVEMGFEELNNVKWANKSTDLFTSEEDSITSEESEDFGTINYERDKTIQEIWEDEKIWENLQSLPGAGALIELINAESIQQLLEHRNAKDTGLLLAAWMGNDRITKLLLRNSAYVNMKDNDGRTALHLAALAGNDTCLKILLDHKASVSTWDSLHKAQPLHCAASRGRLGCVKLLIKHGADVNSGIAVKSPLHYAVQNNAVDCVETLLASGAIPNTPQVFSETPLHVAAAFGSPQLIQILLKYGAEVRVQCGSDKSTALHLAAADGNLECVKLLLQGGALINATNKKLQTPLHLAALAQCGETVEYLLNKGANPNSSDINGRTPLHSAISKGVRSIECVTLLIKGGANVNKPDDYGYTPLHLAALNEFSYCVLLLLSSGGDVTAKTKGGNSVLTFITRRTPRVIPKFIEKLDASIKVNDHEIGDVDCELKLDFRILVPAACKGETELFLHFIEVGHREILQHPLCETFLFLKWRRIRKFFLFSLFYHSLFVILYSIYTYGVYMKNCPPTLRRGLPVCTTKIDTAIVGYFLLILNILFMAKEIFQIAHSQKSYIKQWENSLQWFIIISVFSCVSPVNNTDVRFYMKGWQHEAAAVGIFLSWVELMLIIGRFPAFGLYVQMFRTVSYNFTKFFVAYCCLLIAFALSFSILLPSYQAFSTIYYSLPKVIMMMSGELEFDDIFHDDKSPKNYGSTAHIMFLCFVILVTIILTNLMVGLAVSDIQGLQRSAGLDRLVRQAELVAHLESILFSRLLAFLPKQFLAFLYKNALLLKSEYHWALYIRPNDPREKRIPKDLIKSIYELICKTKPKRKKKSERRKNLARLDSKSESSIELCGKQSALKNRLQFFHESFKNENSNILMK